MFEMLPGAQELHAKKSDDNSSFNDLLRNMISCGRWHVCICRTRSEQGDQDQAGSLSTTHGGPYAIICAGAVNQDGRSSGLTAPNGPSQTALVQEALVSGQLYASAVGTISVHGTGTPLGDPIEVGALGQGLKVGGYPLPHEVGTHQPLELVSNKSCFGHTEGAAGLTGLLLAVGCLQDCSRPPIMHLRGMNPHVGAALVDWHRQMGLEAVIPRQAHGESLHDACGCCFKRGDWVVNALCHACSGQHNSDLEHQTLIAVHDSTIACLTHGHANQTHFVLEARACSLTG